MAGDRRFGLRSLCGALAALSWVGATTSATARDQTQWVRQLGTSADDTSFDRGGKVATDGEGNVYISGGTRGSLGGAHQGESDAWLAKYSAAGALRWKRQLGTHDLDVSSGLATDGDGNVYITGFTTGSLGGTNHGEYDAWLAKYSATGALLWTKQLGTSAGDFSYSVATDGKGHVYIAGITFGSLGGGGAYQSHGNAWLAKYSAVGALLWTRQRGSFGGLSANSVATDGDGNVYTSGDGSLPWLVKYSSAGALLWTRQLGTSVSFDVSLGVATDGDSNVYITGFTDGSLGGPNQGEWDAWLAKYSAAGTLCWKRQLGTDNIDVSHSVATDEDGNIYISGGTQGSLGGAYRGEYDAWLAKYSPAGALRWKRQLGTSATDISQGIAADGDGNVYISGYTNGSLGGANQGGYDAWLAKFFTRR